MMSVFSNAGWDNNEWVIADSVDYPHLSWEGTGFHNISSADPVPLEGLGTEEAPYQIWTPEEFALLSWYSSILDKHIVLMADINLNGKKLYPIGDLGLFSGVFDGKGYIISNAAIIQPKSDYVGLFGHIGIAGVVENLCTENTEITGFGYVGGLAGNSFGNIRDCHVTGDVTGGENNIGGLVGNNLGEIHNCYTKGSVTGVGRNVGGLAGNSNNVNNCYSNSDVKGSGYLGGLLGRSSGSISNSYANGSVDGTSDFIGGLVGYSHQSPINSCHATGSVKGSLEESRFVGGLAGFQKGPISDCYATGSVTATGWIGGLVGDTYSYSIITNCYATGDIIGNGGTVGGLAGRSRGPITDSFATGSVKGYGKGLTSSFVRVGGLVGEDDGSIKRSYSTSSVYGDGDHVGGLAGKGSGLIKDCYSTGSVEGIGNCIGGLLGFFHGKIFDCYATGSIIASGDNVGGLVGKIHSAQIANCYSIGLVACSGSDIGGLVGSNDRGTVTSSFWDVQTSSIGVSGDDNFGATGKTTPEMQTQSTLTGWDFVGGGDDGVGDVWRMCVDGVGYPRLSWEYSSVGDFACGDGVGVGDLVYLCERWLAEGEAAGAGDGDGDGRVDLGDFGVLGAGW